MSSEHDPELPLGELAVRLGAELSGDPDLVITGVAELAVAGPGQIAPLTDLTRLEEGRRSAASALLVRRHLEDLPRAQLICPDPSAALGLLLQLFRRPAAPSPQGIDPRAVVDATAAVDGQAWVGPLAYVGPGAVVEALACIEPFAYVGPCARVGRGCHLYPGAMVLQGCELGEGVVLGPGAVVGFEGFGYFRDGERWCRIPSVGTVVIGDGAELGANTCVDRGTLGPTRVGAGAKLDNLVQVGHNAQVEARALLCAQVGLAGSVHVAQDAILAGQVGVADHRRVGRGARVGAQSGVGHDVKDGAEVSGSPAFDHRAWLRSSALFPRLAELARQVRRLRGGRSQG